MKLIGFSLLFVLLVSACSHKMESGVPTTGFVRKAGTITLDTNGSCLLFTNASDGKLSFALTWVTPTGGRDTVSMPDAGYFKQDGWFVYVESPSRIWTFDGDRQLDVITPDGKNAVTMPGVFETCPQTVWDAVPESVRRFLHDKRAAYQSPLTLAVPPSRFRPRVGGWLSFLR
jgi:hypothetical protein